MYDPVWRQQGPGQNLAVGSVNAASNPVGTTTWAVRLSSVAHCHVAIGRPAVATDMLLKSTDISQVIAISPGQTVNVIQDGTSTGTLNMVELTH